MQITSALVTGASSGIGEQFCYQLAPRCERIIAVARRGERLDNLARDLAGRTEIIPVVADLATVEGVTRTVEALRQRGPVDLLVNNAGFTSFSPLAQSDIAVELEQVRIHVDAAVSLCRAAVPFMREAGGGRIINVASVGAFPDLPMMAVYGGCKAFLASFSRSLQAEVADSNIRVQCLCPGMTRTGIHDHEAFAGFDKTQIPESMWMDAAAVVSASLGALESGEVLLVTGAPNVEVVAGALQQQLDSVRQ